MMLTRRTLILLLATLLIGTAMVGRRQGSSSTTHRAGTTEDSWYRALPSGTQLWKWAELERDRLHEVISAERASSETLLQDVACMSVDDH